MGDWKKPIPESTKKNFKIGNGRLEKAHFQIFRKNFKNRMLQLELEKTISEYYERSSKAGNGRLEKAHFRVNQKDPRTSAAATFDEFNSMHMNIFVEYICLQAGQAKIRKL